MDMHRIQELVRLLRLGTGYRETARLLGMSPNTERIYRKALANAGLLESDPADVPELATLKAAVAEKLPLKPSPQHISSVEPWRDRIVE